MARTPRTPRRYETPRRGGVGRIYTSPPVDITFADPTHRCYRVDLEIDCITHAGSTYRGLIFLNNPKANGDTPRTAEERYAGHFTIFGHGGCLGDPGHCEVNDHNRDVYDLRPPHALTPALKRVVVTDTVRDLAKIEKTATITIVPVVMAANSLCETEDVFRFEKMSFVAYN